MTPRVIVFARAPARGLVKTRLARDVGDDRALALYRWCGAVVMAQLRDPRWLRWVAFTPADGRAATEAWLGPADRYLAQPDGDLGARLAAATAAAFADGDGPVLLVGADCPALTAGRVAEAAAALATHDAVLGPAYDGGYYLLGLARPLAVFEGVPWSTAAVADETRERLRAAGATWRELPTERDIDEVGDLVALADRADAPEWVRVRTESALTPARAAGDHCPAGRAPTARPRHAPEAPLMAMNINKALDKKYEGKTLKELTEIPVEGLEGLSADHGALLAKLGIKTVRDLAEWKFVAWAQAICALAKAEE